MPSLKLVVATYWLPAHARHFILIFLSTESSCAGIRSYVYNKNLTSHGRSGYYVLKTDHFFFAYCDMELDCGGTKGGWMRIAGDICPSG